MYKFSYRIRNLYSYNFEGVILHEAKLWPEKIKLFARLENIFNSKYETMGVLGEAASDEVNVPIEELGDTGIGDTAVGPLDPNFLSPGQPRSIFIGINLQW